MNLLLIKLKTNQFDLPTRQTFWQIPSNLIWGRISADLLPDHSAFRLPSAPYSASVESCLKGYFIQAFHSKDFFIQALTLRGSFTQLPSKYEKASGLWTE